MRKRKKDSFGVMAEAIAKYMREQGWEIIVLGKMKVQQYPSDLKFNYELVFRFTGKRIKEPKNVKDR